MPDDHLLKGLDLLAAGNEYDMITWCPEQHVLSFRRQGGWQWVNLWLHARDYEKHVTEVNGGEYGWGGSNPQVLWVDGRDGEQGWISNSPQRRIDGRQNPTAGLDGRFAWIGQLPDVPGIIRSQPLPSTTAAGDPA